MTIVKAFAGAISGTFADQWLDIVTAPPFDEYTVVVPGVLKQTNRGRGSNYKGSVGVLSNGSKIFVPENVAAVVFSQAGIENVIAEPGGYEYWDGMDSVFAGGSVQSSLVDQVADRVKYGGQPVMQKQIVFVNLREIRGIKFGTRGPLVYNDHFYGADLEITAFGSFSLRVVEPGRLLRFFVPPNVFTYSFAMPQARRQLLPEFLQALTVALNSLSGTYRISQLPAQAEAVARQMATVEGGAASWPERFGLAVVGVGIENIEFTPESRELVHRYAANRMSVSAFDGVSAQSSNIAAQQRIAQGIENHGLGDGGGMVFGMNMAQSIDPQTAAPVAEGTMSLDQQVQAVRKFKELLDEGMITEEEFKTKKREIMGF